MSGAVQSCPISMIYSGKFRESAAAVLLVLAVTGALLGVVYDA